MSSPPTESLVPPEPTPPPPSPTGRTLCVLRKLLLSFDPDTRAESVSPPFEGEGQESHKKVWVGEKYRERERTKTPGLGETTWREREREGRIVGQGSTGRGKKVSVGKLDSPGDVDLVGYA